MEEIPQARPKEESRHPVSDWMRPTKAKRCAAILEVTKLELY